MHFRFLAYFFCLVFSFSLWANTEITTQVHDLDRGTNVDEVFLFLTSGQVVILKNPTEAMLEDIKKKIKSKEWLTFFVNEKREIQSYTLARKRIPKELPLKFLSMDEPYVPSVLKTLDDARVLFNQAKIPTKPETQCYNRAHAWTYEWRKNNNLYSSKVWLFFTRKFIRKYKFEWWFHVSPMVNVIINDEVKERVMDVKYARGPIKLNQWTDIFIRDGADCPVVTKYSDQADYPESGHCFLMKSSMYYYQPVDLERLETTGIEKNRWKADEVKHAFLEAFETEI